MLDIKLFRENPDIVRKDLKKRKYADKLNLIDEVIKADSQWRKELIKRDKLKNLRNVESKKIAGIKGKKEKEKKIREMQENNKKIQEVDGKCAALEKIVIDLLSKIPNLMDESVPYGKDDSENIEIKKWGKKAEFGFKPLSHQELCEKNDWYDVVRGAKVAGARNYFLKNDLARLQFALFSYALDFLKKKGFSLMIPPYMAYDKCFFGTGYLPEGKEDLYEISGQGMSLIGTSEVPITSYYMNETLNENDLPKKFCGYSACFRTEAGSHGKDEKGIFRVHQFDKIEMVILCAPEKSKEMHEFLLKNAEEFWQSLGMHYRVVNICTGDLGIVASKKYDIEAWFPGQDKYREVVSCSNFKDYQSRRLNIKLREKEGMPPKNFLHTLNSTLVTNTRCLIAIIENFQTKEGKVLIPKALQPYMNCKKLLE
ncbi:MAG: serine--tRNA ligase [Candidatus Nanoarchaeia archaeon]|nr:serine--tRNA ligase [Candidatus Nanoarchaeia archaeon]